MLFTCHEKPARDIFELSSDFCCHSPFSIASSNGSSSPLDKPAFANKQAAFTPIHQNHGKIYDMIVYPASSIAHNKVKVNCYYHTYLIYCCYKLDFIHLLDTRKDAVS